MAVTAAAAITDLPAAVQTAMVLGLPRPASFDDLKLADAIGAGLSTRSVDAVVKRLDPGGGRLKPSQLVPKSTLHRLAEGNKRLSPEASETLWRIARVYLEAMQLYRSSDEAMEFLFRPHPLLDRRTPFEVAKGTSAGAALVIELLLRARFGIAV